MRFLSRLLAAAGLSVSVGAHAGLASPPNAIIVIGDSYSDSGNAFAATGGTFPYPSGRFSDGPVWIEQVAQALGRRADPTFAPAPPGVTDLPSNFAVGGAQIGTGNSLDAPPAFAFGVPTGMTSQTGYLLQAIATTETSLGLPAGFFASSFLPSSLFVVQAAGNDYRRWTDINDQTQLQSIIDDSIASFGAIVSTLHQSAGATQFLIPNMPGYTEFDDPFVGTIASARQFAEAYNAALSPTLSDLRTQLGVNIIEVDFFGLFDQISANPAAFGISSVGVPCVDFNAFLQVLGVCGNPETTLMWDSLHPTSATHALLAEAALTAIGPVPVPAAILLFTPALLGLGMSRRRLAR